MGELKNVTIINAYYVSKGNLLGFPVKGDLERNKDQAANMGTELKAYFVKT